MQLKQFYNIATWLLNRFCSDIKIWFRLYSKSLGFIYTCHWKQLILVNPFTPQQTAWGTSVYEYFSYSKIPDSTLLARRRVLDVNM